MSQQFSSSDGAELAQRLRLLIDFHTVEHGEEPTYPAIADFLNQREIGLSRSRWSYMLNGHRGVNDHELLQGLAAFFNVDEKFLTDSGPVPERVGAQLDLIRSMRESRVRAFAARTLGDVSPDTLRAITKFLDAEAERRQKE